MAKKVRRLPFAVRVAYAMDAVPEAAKANLNGSSLMMAINAIEAQRSGIDPRKLGLDIDKDSTVEEIVARFCPECGDESAASVAELLTKLKGTPETVSVEETAKEDEEPEMIEKEDEKLEVKDEETEEEQKAFAEGVDYGEEKEKEEPEHLDRLHESEGTKRFDEEKEEKPAVDEDKDAKIEKILASLPDLDDEKKAALAEALKDLAYSTATGEDEEPEEMPEEEMVAEEMPADEEEEEEVAVATDSKNRRRKVAMDTNSIRKKVRAELVADFRQRSRAANQVRGILGNVDVMAYDSAASIYGDALKKVGINVRAYAPSSYAAMFAAYSASTKAAKPVAMDTQSVKYDGKFAHLKNIKIGD